MFKAQKNKQIQIIHNLALFVHLSVKSETNDIYLTKKKCKKDTSKYLSIVIVSLAQRLCFLAIA